MDNRVMSVTSVRFGVLSLILSVGACAKSANNDPANVGNLAAGTGSQVPGQGSGGIGQQAQSGGNGSVNQGGAGKTATSTAGTVGPSGGNGSTPMNQSGAGMNGAAGGTQPHMPTSTDSWPMMGYDTRNNYFNPNEKTLSVANAPNLKEKWRFMVDGYPPGTPIIADGLVFVIATGATYALNLDDGSMVWKSSDITGTASAAYSDGFVYLHASAGAKLYKVEAKTGKVVWGPISTYPENASCDGTSSPIVAKGKVIVGHSCGVAEVTAGDDQTNAKGGVEAFNIADGTQAWRYQTVAASGENGAMVWSTVSVDLDGDTVFAATGNNYTMPGENSDSIHAISLIDGKRKWKNQVRQGDMWTLQSIIGGSLDTDFGANPIIAEVGGKKIVANGDKGAAFWAMDRDTGMTLWSRQDMSASHDQAHGGMLMNGAFDGKYFYAASNDASAGTAQLHALDPANMGMDVWPAVKLEATVWGAPSLANGLLVVPVNSILRVFDASKGTKLIEFETGGTIAAGAAAIAAGRIVVKSGLTYVFDAATKNNNLVICYGL